MFLLTVQVYRFVCLACICVVCGLLNVYVVCILHCSVGVLCLCVCVLVVYRSCRVCICVLVVL